MTGLEIVLGALLILASLVMIVVIILQEGNQQGVGVVSGGADTFFSKNKARSYDAFLARATKWFAIGFVAVVLALNIFAFFSGKKAETKETDTTTVSEDADTTAEDTDADAEETGDAETGETADDAGDVTADDADAAVVDDAPADGDAATEAAAE